MNAVYRNRVTSEGLRLFFTNLMLRSMEVVYPLGLISQESGVRIPPPLPEFSRISTVVVQSPCKR